MHAQVHASTGHGRHSLPNRNSLYTPTYSASDKEEEEIEGSDPDLDLSDYYSDSGYPTQPRPRVIVLSSRRNTSLPARGSRDNSHQLTPPARLQRKAATQLAHGNKQTDSSHARSRKIGLAVVSSPAAPTETSCNKTKAFSKLRSLRNNRINPVSSPERERPTSSLATTSICANGKSISPRHASHSVHPKQLRSASLPEGDKNMALAKPKKSRKPNRSFSFGSGDKKKTRNILFRSLSRSGDEIEPEAPHSPLLVGRKVVKTGTIYEEDARSLSSVEEEERLNSMNYLHGNRFGSCRELSTAGIAAGSRDLLLRPLSRSKHKRPSLPSFAKFLPQSRRDTTTVTTVQEPPSDQQDSQSRDSDDFQTPPSSATSSPRPLRRRKLSDPGSAPSTPEAGNSPPAERRLSREEGGVARGSRPLRKGFTFSVGGSKLSPDWREMRHHVVRFLLETEQSYVQSLKTIIKVYLEPLKKPRAFGLIDSSLVADIFYQIPEICTLHERFLLQIRQRTDHWHPMQKIGDVFVNTFSKCHLMNIYTKFIHNFMRAKAAIEIAKQARPDFAKYLERAKYSTGKLSLDDLLIKPVQRIPRYLLFIKDLLKHTSMSHPDHAPLQQALDELTGLAERVNESEREMARMDQQRELLAAVDGLALFVHPESELVRYDLVTEAQGSAYKRDRFLILFSDVLVCASARRKSTGLRRGSLLNLNTLSPDSFRYKIKWSHPLKELSLGEVQAPMVERKKKNTLEKMIENLSKDEATLTQMLEASSTLRKQYQALTTMLKDTLSEVRETVAAKRAELESLPLLHSRVDLMCYSSLPPTQYSIVFPSQKIRNSWEADFQRVKQSTCLPALDVMSSRLSRDGGFEFLHPLHLHSGRLGMELSCAGIGPSADSNSPHNLWVSCCDGYGGQVCLLDLQTSTRPHIVANITVSDSKILCISAVPLEGESEVGEPGREARPQSTSLSLESEVEQQDGQLGILSASQESEQELAHPELVSKTTHSLPQGLRGSLVASFSSDSSSETTTISRTPSMSSTRSEQPSDTKTPSVVGVVTDMLDSVSRTIGFRGHEDAMGCPRKKNGFHRVCSNSAPDLLKVVSGHSPTEDLMTREERGATSLSPPPPAESKFWSPLTLHPSPQDGDKKGPPEGRGTSMWLGTEGGQILVYSPGSSLRSRNNRCTLHLPAAVHSIRFHRQKVFVGLANGTLAVFDPQHPTAGHTHLINISSAPIVSCTSLGGQLLVASQSTLYSVDAASMDATPILSLPENQSIQSVEGASGEEGERVWVSMRDRPLLHLYHLPTTSLLTSIDCTQKVNDVLRGYSPVIRQNKTASLRITSLLSSHQHLLIGTSAGVILTLPLTSNPSLLSPPSDLHPLPSPLLSHLPQGHVDSASFLCELRCHDSSLILSGGTGCEDFTTSNLTHQIAETASCLMIWRLLPQQDSPD